MAVDPRGADLERVLAEDPGGPVVMLDLLRFRPDGGRERDADDVEDVRRTSATHGAQVRFVGDGSTALVAGPGQSWDAVLLVRCPSRQASSDVVRDPAYGEGTHLRTEALEEAVLQATVPWTGTGG